MCISKQDGKRKKRLCTHSLFFRSGKFLLVERGQDCLYLDLTSYHADVSARVKVFVASKKISYRLQLKGCNNSANCIQFSVRAWGSFAPFLFSIHGFSETDYLESNNLLLLETDTFLPCRNKLLALRFILINHRLDHVI